MQEVNSAVRRLFSLPSVEASSSSSEDSETAPIDELLDVLIALLDKGSSDLRNLANLIFGMISSAFTPSSVQHLVAVSLVSQSKRQMLMVSPATRTDYC